MVRECLVGQSTDPQEYARYLSLTMGRHLANQQEKNIPFEKISNLWLVIVCPNGQSTNPRETARYILIFHCPARQPFLKSTTTKNSD
jgi:hypothetical protein